MAIAVLVGQESPMNEPVKHSELCIYTIGHGGRKPDELMELLIQTGINTIVDVRSNPHPSATPWCSEDNLRTSIEELGKIYHWAGRQLGGKRKILADSRNMSLRNEALRAYADYMQTEAFQVAAMQLTNLATKGDLVILSADQDPYACHRGLIADYLVLKGVRIVHIISEIEVREHLLSEFARRESCELIYDRQVI